MNIVSLSFLFLVTADARFTDSHHLNSDGKIAPLSMDAAAQRPTKEFIASLREDKHSTDLAILFEDLSPISFKEIIPHSFLIVFEKALTLEQLKAKSKDIEWIISLQPNFHKKLLREASSKKY